MESLVMDVPVFETEPVEAEFEVTSYTRQDLDNWFVDVISSFPSGRSVARESLSESEYLIVCRNSVCTGFDITYHLLQKHLSIGFDEQLPVALKIKSFLEYKRIPKRYLGGFLILLTKYHYLPM